MLFFLNKDTSIPSINEQHQWYLISIFFLYQNEKNFLKLYTLLHKMIKTNSLFNFDSFCHHSNWISYSCEELKWQFVFLFGHSLHNCIPISCRSCVFWHRSEKRSRKEYFLKTSVQEKSRRKCRSKRYERKMMASGC